MSFVCVKHNQDKEPTLKFTPWKCANLIKTSNSVQTLSKLCKLWFNTFKQFGKHDNLCSYMCLAKLRFHPCTKPTCIHPSLGFILPSYKLHFASFSHHLVSLISALQSLAFRLLPLHFHSQNQHFTPSILHFAYPNSF